MGVEPKRRTLFDKFRSQNALKKRINNEEGVTGNKTSYIGSREAEEKKEILIKDKPRTAQIEEPLFKKEKEEVKEMKEGNIKGELNKAGLFDRIKPQKKIDTEKNVMRNKTSLIGSREAEEKKGILPKNKENIKVEPKKKGFLNRIKSRDALDKSVDEKVEGL